MKGLVVLFVLALVAIIGYFQFMKSMDSDSQVLVSSAFGNSDKGTCEIHVVVQPLTVKTDPPRADLSTGFVYWDEWLDAHYNLTEDGGKRVKFERAQWSPVISDKEAGGAPEFYLKGKVKQGANYTFEFTPLKDGPRKYRRTFTAPNGDQKMSRDIFALVKE